MLVWTYPNGCFKDYVTSFFVKSAGWLTFLLIGGSLWDGSKAFTVNCIVYGASFAV